MPVINPNSARRYTIAWRSPVSLCMIRQSAGRRIFQEIDPPLCLPHGNFSIEFPGRDKSSKENGGGSVSPAV